MLAGLAGAVVMPQPCGDKCSDLVILGTLVNGIINYMPCTGTWYLRGEDTFYQGPINRGFLRWGGGVMH